MPYNQRDIVLVEFPFTDLSNSKLRPALILSSPLVNKYQDFICVQITSKMFEDDLYFLLEDEMLKEVLPMKSGVRMHKLFCLNERLINQKISEMKPLPFLELSSLLQRKVFNMES